MHFLMLDCFITNVWRILLVLLIVSLGVVAMDWLYRGLLDALCGEFAGAAKPVLAGATLALCVYLLCRYRNDIVYG